MADESVSGQAQPKKLRIASHDEERYQAKMTLKAEIIVASANRLWGTFACLPPCLLFPTSQESDVLSSKRAVA